ncbi:hypothetical protein CPC08DRAFT_715821 [Agrocybe pediades]|nr:hypothetical protein CPC08DRAFT_715821 [Agrocybe pediades]
MIYLHGALTTSKSSPNHPTSQHGSAIGSAPSFWAMKTLAAGKEESEGDPFYPVPIAPPSALSRLHSMMKPIRRAFTPKRKRGQCENNINNPLGDIKSGLKRVTTILNPSKGYDPVIVTMDSSDLASLLNPGLSNSQQYPSTSTTYYTQSNPDGGQSFCTLLSVGSVSKSLGRAMTVKETYNGGPDTTLLRESKTFVTLR